MKKATILVTFCVLFAGVIGTVFAGQEKVVVCHKPGTENEETLTIAAPAIDVHLAHGDFEGECTLSLKTSIVGHKWEDLDADGVIESGEPGLGGWRIYVDYDNDFEFDLGEPSSLTAGDGSYAIVDIDPGTWTVRELGQDGWNCSYPNQGGEVHPVISAECSHTLTLDPGAALKGVEFANWRPAIKAGYKWEDRFEPFGEWDQANEPALPGWTIELWDVTTGTPVFVATANTNGSGYYEFRLLDPGKTYVVCELVSFSHIQTFPMASTAPPVGEVIYACSAELGSNYGPYGYQFTAQSSSSNLNNNFGNLESN